MKNLLVLLALTTITTASACNINLVRTTVKSKTLYTDRGETISKSIVEKLGHICKFTSRVMSSEEKLAFDIMRAQKRLDKLKDQVQ